MNKIIYTFLNSVKSPKNSGIGPLSLFKVKFLYINIFKIYFIMIVK